MKIPVTGSAGFIGYHVARRLIERGDSVVGIDVDDCWHLWLQVARLRQLAEVGREDAHLPDGATSDAAFCIFNIGNSNAVKLMEYSDTLEEGIREEGDPQAPPASTRACSGYLLGHVGTHRSDRVRAVDVCAGGGRLVHGAVDTMPALKDPSLVHAGLTGPELQVAGSESPCRRDSLIAP